MKESAQTIPFRGGGGHNFTGEMPSTTPPNDQKSRQSSGGRSFFGRKLHKERSVESKNFDEGNLYPQTPSGASSAANSKSSRHSHRPSVASLDMDNGADLQGLSNVGGIITSIPYDSVSADSKTPIPVEYLPRNDQVPVRKEPLPHHLNKGGGDFHQYPAWDQQSVTSKGSSHPTGPRPPPHTSSQTTLGSISTREKKQSSGKPGTAASTTNGSHGIGSSYSMVDSTIHPRNSFDQASIYSSVSSATRGSSIFSSDNSSRTAIPPYLQDNLNRPSSAHSTSRQSNIPQNGLHPQQPAPFNTTTSFTPEGFNLPRPTDEHVIEQQFIALMHKRGWQNLPDQARRQMMAYPAVKKWTLVHQDKLTEWQGEQKRRQHARQTIAGADILGRADEEGSPEWFVRKVLDDSITAKQLQSLSVSLRTQPIR